VSAEHPTPGEIIPPGGDDTAGYDAAGKTAKEIEQDIGETRAELGEILDALERQLSPRQLLERGVDMLKDTMSGDTTGLAETLRSHPIPLALIGAGLGWLLMGGARSGRVGETAAALRDRVADRAQGVAGKVRDKVADASATAQSAAAPYQTEAAGYAYARQKSGQARSADWQGSAGAGGGTMQDKLQRARQAGSTAWQRAGDAGSTAWRRAGDYAGGAGDQLGEMRDRVVELVEEHPIAIGALGFLAGALTALLLPRSEAERRWVGPAGERLRQQAADMSREVADRAQHVAEQTIDAATGAVRNAVNEAAEHAGGRGTTGAHSGSSGEPTASGSSGVALE